MASIPHLAHAARSFNVQQMELVKRAPRGPARDKAVAYLRAEREAIEREISLAEQAEVPTITGNSQE